MQGAVNTLGGGVHSAPSANPSGSSHTYGLISLLLTQKTPWKMTHVRWARYCDAKLL